MKKFNRILIAIIVLVALSVVPRVAAQGSLTNGWTHTGTIAPVGDSDSWTFSASIGDRIVIKVGEISQTNTFTPRLRLQNPGAVQIAVASGAVAAEITVTATNTGTFTVIVDDAVGTTATGTYRLTLGKSPGAIFVAPGDEGGPLTNGVAHQGDLPIGDLDVWSFTATAGESIVLKMGQITDVSSFDPWVRLYGPDGVLVGSSFDFAAAEVTVRATNSDTFLVVVGNNPYNNAAGNGTYLLTLAKTGNPIVVSPSDEGGSMTNGVAYQANLPIGDLDAWSFTANVGEAIVVKIGQITDAGSFDPWVRLYGPEGVLVGTSYGTAAAEVTARATNSGTFLVVIGNNPYHSDAGSGTYLLTLAKTGSPIVVSPGDEGGPLTNGVAHQGDLPIGDLDVWSFTATAGESIVLKMGQITDVSSFDPWVRLYGPDGVLVASDSDANSVEIAVRATNSGTFLVVIANDPYYSDAGNGTYLLTLAKTGDAIFISTGDEGGPLTNGVAHIGNMPLGDLDLWNFTANSGDNLVVKVGQITETNNFAAIIRLYGPDGALLASNWAGSAAEVAVRATNSGTFLVVIANYPYYSGAASGTYLLTLAKTGSPIVISPGEEGGSLTNGWAHTGFLQLGDLDLWNFSATAGQNLIVRVGQIAETNNFAPMVRLYGPDGALIRSDWAAAVAEVSVKATNSGDFLVVIANYPYYSDAAYGTYLLTLAKTGSTSDVAPGDEGGRFEGGSGYTGNIPVGDLDVWTFTACLGELVQVRADQLSETNAFDPEVRIYNPSGVLVAANYGLTFASVSFFATNSGPYLAVIGNNDYNNNLGSGTYQLTVNGLTDGFKMCIPAIAGTNVALGAVGGVSNATFILYTHTNVATPQASWFPIYTNQFDQYGSFRRTNLFDKTERERYYRISTQ